jgi:hypothetical protein
MFLVMLGAFLSASIANLGTDAANLVHKPRAAAHESDAQAACFRAIETQPRALRHTPQTFVGTMITFLSTAATGCDTRLMFLVRHDYPPASEDRIPISPQCKQDAEETARRKISSPLPFPYSGIAIAFPLIGGSSHLADALKRKACL